MLVLCYASPTLCDLAKHWRRLNALIQAKYASPVQNAMAYGGLWLRGGHISQCLEDEHSRAPSLRRWRPVTRVSRSSGPRRATPTSMLQAFRAAGPRPAQTPRGPLSGSAHRPRCHAGDPTRATTDGAPATLRGASPDADAALRRLTSYGPPAPSPTPRCGGSVPGQPLPRAPWPPSHLQDQVRFGARCTSSTGVAITSSPGNAPHSGTTRGRDQAHQHLTDEQRRLLEKRLDGLQDLAQMVAKRGLGAALPPGP
jgi:hypothetical protein